MPDSSFNDLLATAKHFTESTGRDLLVFSGAINGENCDQFIKAMSSLVERRPKVALFLCTYGGDPHAAYRMARILRRYYPKDVRILVGGYCKSAGTLLALSASSLGFSEIGELGPLDMQISQRDEVMQMASGLEVFSSLKALTDHAFECFEEAMLTLLRRSDQTISTRLASEIASKLAVGLMKPISAQLDPNRIGVAQRGLEVTKVYGRQIAKQSNNYTGSADALVDRLVNNYPTHSFVIDRDEARELFKDVDDFSEIEGEFYEKLKHLLIVPPDEAFIVNFSSVLGLQETEIEDEAVHQSNRESPGSNSGGPGSEEEGRARNGKPVEASRAKPKEQRPDEPRIPA